MILLLSSQRSCWELSMSQLYALRFNIWRINYIVLHSLECSIIVGTLATLAQHLRVTEPLDKIYEFHIHNDVCIKTVNMNGWKRYIKISFYIPSYKMMQEMENVQWKLWWVMRKREIWNEVVTLSVVLKMIKRNMNDDRNPSPSCNLCLPTPSYAWLITSGWNFFLFK